jgi:hypothetical protein
MTKRIGVLTASSNLFNNGLLQNAFFIYEVFTKQGILCDLLCYDEKFTSLNYNNTPVKTIYDDESKFDIAEYALIITVARGVHKSMYDRCRAQNVKVVAFVCGNVFHLNNAAFVSGSTETIVTKSTPCDEVWIIGSFAYMKSYMEILRAAPVRSVPHLWSPCLIEHATVSVFQRKAAELVYNPSNHTLRKASIFIMEPNIDYVKTALLPIMAVEKLHQQHPDLIEEVLVFCFPANKKAALAIIDSLSVRSKIRIFTRIHIADILTTYNKKSSMPIFLYWQQHHEWNYMYYEMMYYGFPFVHNSNLMGDFGYLYDGINIDKCVEQLLVALESHHTSHEYQMKKARHYLDSIDPDKQIAQCYWKNLIANPSGRSLEPAPNHS